MTDYTTDCAPDCQERTECQRVTIGHMQCGFCETHDMPRHHCTCLSYNAYRDSRPFTALSNTPETEN